MAKLWFAALALIVMIGLIEAAPAPQAPFGGAIPVGSKSGGRRGVEEMGGMSFLSNSLSNSPDLGQ